MPSSPLIEECLAYDSSLVNVLPGACMNGQMNARTHATEQNQHLRVSSLKTMSPHLGSWREDMVMD